MKINAGVFIKENLTLSAAESPVAATTSKEPVIPEVNINDESEFHTEKIEGYVPENSKKRGSTRCSIVSLVPKTKPKFESFQIEREQVYKTNKNMCKKLE